MNISEILDDYKYYGSIALDKIEFKRITYTKDKTDEECVFFHIRGVNYDTEELNSEIVDKKPCAIVCDYESKISSEEIPIFYVKNARVALAWAYYKYYGIDSESTRFVGVTGTNGKTTTATMIKTALASEGRRVGFIGTGKIESDGHVISKFDYSMTTPDPDVLYSAIKRMQSDGCEYIIMELSSHAIALGKLAPIFFELIVFTNLSHEHIDFHGNMESYYKTKLEIFKRTKLGIFNVDDYYVRRAYSECECQRKSVGILREADVLAKEPKMLGLDGSSYLYRDKDFIFRMNLPLPGAYNIYNSLCALCASIALGCRPCVAKKALANMKAPDGRLQIIKGADLTVIIDYAHTPFAFENVLKTISSAKNIEQKLICVFGCGGLRDKNKRPLMAEAAERFSDFLVITEDNSRSESRESIINEIMLGVTDKSKTAVIPSRQEAIESAIFDASAGDIIAVLGKGAEKYNIDSTGTHPFDEKEIIENALARRALVIEK